MKSVEIIGGGLAGLALGIRLRREGVPVGIIEKESYPRHRTCGEFLNGVDPGVFACLGIADTLAPAVPRDRVAWHHLTREPVRWRLRRPAVALSRHALDARLAEEFLARGGHLAAGAAPRRLEPRPGVVFASGRRPDPASRWTGLKVHLDGLVLEDDLEFHVGRGGYVGLCALDDGTVNVCGLFRPPRAVRSRPATGLSPDLRASGLDRLADRLDGAALVPGSFHAVSGLSFGKQRVPPGAVCVGDAHAVVPPFAGLGITTALASGVRAAPPLAGWARREISWEQAREEVDRQNARLFARRLRVTGLLHPFLCQTRAVQLASWAQRLHLLPLRRVCAWLY